MAKKIGVIINFDEVDYSEDERDLLWGRLACLLVEASKNPKKENENAKCTYFTNNTQTNKRAACF